MKSAKGHQEEEEEEEETPPSNIKGTDVRPYVCIPLLFEQIYCFMWICRKMMFFFFGYLIMLMWIVVFEDLET